MKVDDCAAHSKGKSMQCKDEKTWRVIFCACTLLFSTRIDHNVRVERYDRADDELGLLKSEACHTLWELICNRVRTRFPTVFNEILYRTVPATVKNVKFANGTESLRKVKWSLYTSCYVGQMSERITSLIYLKSLVERNRKMPTLNVVENLGQMHRAVMRYQNIFFFNRKSKGKRKEQNTSDKRKDSPFIVSLCLLFQ